MAKRVVAQFLRITSQPIPDLREQGLPGEVATAIERAMARDPSDRPASAAEFGEDLRAVQRNHGEFVDDMVRPVELGLEGRKSPVARTHRRLTEATPTPPTPATKYRPPVAIRSVVPRLAEAINPIVRGVDDLLGPVLPGRDDSRCTRINTYLMRWARKKYRVGLTPDGGHLTGGTAGPAGRMSVCRASVGSTPRSFGSRLPAW